jgi:DNA polymerase III alpha subunit (gram-positive type)
MIIFDTETTGLTEPEAMPLTKQPQIIEYAAIKLDDETLEEVDRLEFLCDPGKPLPPEIIRITGLKDSDLAGKPKFCDMLHKLREFHLGERTIIAHNAAFDLSLMRYEMRRLDAMQRFPWPYNQVCTVVQSMPIKGFRLNMQKLHEHCFGKGFEGAHRAMTDVEALSKCVVWMINHDLITLPKA